MKRFTKTLVLLLIVILVGIASIIETQTHFAEEQKQLAKQQDYWFLLQRKSQVEHLFQGVPGDIEHSKKIMTFQVKTGRPGERPTPLPQLVGKDYWVITEMHPEFESTETAPYFITLDVPAPLEPPYGPVPYEECDGQCDWILPGDFGLHGIAGNPEKLSKEDPGSSGCVRHTDKDITYLYNLLKDEKREIRYYIEDN